MSAVGVVAAFLLGLCLSVQVVGALFAPVDLWYDRRRSWPIMVRAIVCWCAVAAVTAWALGAYRESFLWGLGAFPLLHAAIFHISRRSLRRNRRQLDEELRRAAPPRPDEEEPPPGFHPIFRRSRL